MKTTLSKKGILRLEPEGTYDSYELGLLIGNWTGLVVGNGSIFTIGLSSDTDNPHKKLDYVEFPFERFRHYTCCVILNRCNQKDVKL